MSTLEDRRLKQSPVVLLTDCLTDKSTWNQLISFDTGKTIARKGPYPSSLEKGFVEEPMNGLLTPVPSTSSLSTNSDESLEKKKTRKMEEYEVEKVVGYHIGKRRQISYYLKWKGWGPEHNTYQTIEDMTNCNKLLMEFFEVEKPTQEEIDKMDTEVEKSVLRSELYNRLKRTNFKKSEFLRFMSALTPNLSLLFSDKYQSTYAQIKVEYEYVVRCLIGMYYHRDPGMFVRAQHYKIALKFCKMREKQLKKLKNQEDFINSIEKCPVLVLNERDLDVLPEDVKYITELKSGNGVIIPQDPLIGCDCPEACSPSSKCCAASMKSYFAYTKDRKLKWFGTGIYECNWRCKCPPDCRNRVVQRGRNIPVAIFKTEHCGWGVKTLQEIQKGSFVCEYFGEVITEKESNVREVEYFPKNMSYIFDLDFEPDKIKYCIDATREGNFSRFINHSCEPNLIVCAVWVDCLDPYMPQLAFFSRRRIHKGEELSIDYQSGIGGSEGEGKTQVAAKSPPLISRNRCYCNKPKCREWLFGSL